MPETIPLKKFLGVAASFKSYLIWKEKGTSRLSGGPTVVTRRDGYYRLGAIALKDRKTNKTINDRGYMGKTLPDSFKVWQQEWAIVVWHGKYLYHLSPEKIGAPVPVSHVSYSKDETTNRIAERSVPDGYFFWDGKSPNAQHFRS